jgi:hypothetical protein
MALPFMCNLLCKMARLNVSRSSALWVLTAQLTPPLAQILKEPSFQTAAQ